jgi:hypothetical protein
VRCALSVVTNRIDEGRVTPGAGDQRPRGVARPPVLREHIAEQPHALPTVATETGARGLQRSSRVGGQVLSWGAQRALRRVRFFPTAVRDPLRPCASFGSWSFGFLSSRFRTPDFGFVPRF